MGRRKRSRKASKRSSVVGKPGGTDRQRADWAPGGKTEWDQRNREQTIRNIRLSEKVEQDTIDAGPKSKKGRSAFNRLDRLRTQLIKLGGVQMPWERED